MRKHTYDEVLAAVTAYIDEREWADAEAAALACTPEECARIDAELDAWERTPLPASIHTGPRPIA